MQAIEVKILLEEETKEIKKLFYHSPTGRSKLIIKARSQRAGKVKHFSDEEILEYQRRAICVNRQ